MVTNLVFLIVSFLLGYSRQALTQKSFVNKVDHWDDQNPQTYDHYYSYDFSLNDTYDGALNVLHIESPEEYWHYQDNDHESSDVMTPYAFSKQWKARYFTLQHRFYGNSTPFGQFPIFGDYQYLNSSFALHDIYIFINRMNKNEGHKGPWVLQGLGYGGTLAAWYQHAYPDSNVTTGDQIAWASSAPIKVQSMQTGVDMNTYNSVSQSCASKISDFTYDVQRTLIHGTIEQKNAISKIFNKTPYWDKLNEYDFMFFLSDFWGRLAQKLELRDDAPGDLCNAITVKPLMLALNMINS